MPKRTFGLLDVAASVRDVKRSCIGYRVANVYDIDLKTYLFKLQKKDQPKQILLMESGVRFHVTDFVRDKSDSPSHFSMKLRKLLPHSAAMAPSSNTARKRPGSRFWVWSGRGMLSYYFGDVREREHGIN